MIRTMLILWMTISTAKAISLIFLARSIAP